MPVQGKYFNPVPLFILFRETIEAAIVVSVLLTFLNKTAPQLKPQVWWGVGCGVFVSLVLAAGFAIAFYTAQNNVFQGQNQIIFQGCIFWVASAFVTFLAFAMLRYKGWEEKWARKLGAQGVQKIAEAADKDGHAATAAEAGGDSPTTLNLALSKGALEQELAAAEQPPPAIPWYKRMFMCTMPVTAVPEDRSHLPWWRRVKLWIIDFMDIYSMFLVVFFAVLREGLESVIFLFGVGDTAPLAIPISGLIGIFCGICVGLILYYSGKQVKDIKWLLFGFATVLFFLAAGACENGANLLMLAGMFGQYHIPAYAYSYPGTALLSSALYGVEGAPPAPSAANLAAAGFNDGDEGPMVVTTEMSAGYVYVKTPEQPWWQAPQWDISDVAGDQDTENHFLSLCKAIFGYNAKPNFIDIVFYLGYWLIVLSIGLWKWHRGTLLDADWKHTRAMRVQAEESRIEQAALDAADAKLKAMDTNSNSSEHSPAHVSQESHGHHRH